MTNISKLNEVVSQSIRNGNACIYAYVKTLDSSPGVYRMLDKDEQVLYVGKAKHLRNRVSSYSRPSGHSDRILRMISQTRSMLFLTTETEIEALLLEQSLIKNLKPKYNVLLRDDKSFASIHLDKSHSFPQVRKHRGTEKGIGTFFGPFANAGSIDKTLNQLQKAFLLRNCTDSTFEARTRPCLMYQIKRCSAPCVGNISKESYGDLISKAEQFLSGKSKEMQKNLVDQMNMASSLMEFEKAAGLRDRIQVLKEVQTQKSSNLGGLQEADIIALHVEKGRACVQVFFIRAFQNWGNKDYFPDTGAGADSEEIMRTFLGQFYSNKTAPSIILLSNDIQDRDLISLVLSKKSGVKVNLAVPRRGRKMDIVNGAMRNARESLARKLANTETQKKLISGLTKTLSLGSNPNRIEVYDNSHFQGNAAVGCMIVAGEEGFLKKEYRKFNIKSKHIKLGDDFAMMREVLSRRFERLKKEDKDRVEKKWPDLVIIDGGVGHLSVVAKVMSELQLEDIRLLGVSKGPDRNAGKEEFHSLERGTFSLKSNDPVLYYVQRLRDEAHRFAIGTHRAKRSKNQFKSQLDEIAGIGGKRKKALLESFGSVKAISQSTQMDIEAVDGISSLLAQSIYEFFHDSE